MTKKLFSALGAGLIALACLSFALPAAAQFSQGPFSITDPASGCVLGGSAATHCALRSANDPYPVNATAVAASSGVVSAATAAAALPAVAAKTNYLAGFRFTSAGATGASVVTCTITGGIGGAFSYVVAVVAGATLQNAVLTESFNPPLAASAVNTAITVSCPTLGAGNTAAAMNAYGYVK